MNWDKYFVFHIFQHFLHFEGISPPPPYPELDDVGQPVVSPDPGRDVGAGLRHLAAGCVRAGGGRD